MSIIFIKLFKDWVNFWLSPTQPSNDLITASNKTIEIYE